MPRFLYTYGPPKEKYQRKLTDAQRASREDKPSLLTYERMNRKQPFQISGFWTTMSLVPLYKK